MPGALDKLDHEHAQSLAHGAKRRPERASGFALSRAGVNDEQALLFRHSMTAACRAGMRMDAGNLERQK